MGQSNSSRPSRPFKGRRPIRPNPNRKLQPGHHIFSERSGDLYYHHGIYVGDDMVIHLMAPAKKNNIGFSAPCQKCGYKRDSVAGVIKTCLNCFLDGHSLHVYEYGFSKPADEVIKKATDFLVGNLSFGPYNLLTNNCEHFATYCKTGSKESEQVEDVVEKVDHVVDDLGEGLIRIAAGMAAVGGVAVAGAYFLDA